MLFGSRACYVALKLVTAIFVRMCVRPSVQRFSPMFVNRSWWNFISNWISVCSCVPSSMGVLGVQWAEPTPQKTVFRGKTISSYSFDRIGLSHGYVPLHWKTKLFSYHFFRFNLSRRPPYVPRYSVSYRSVGHDTLSDTKDVRLKYPTVEKNSFDRISSYRKREWQRRESSH